MMVVRAGPRAPDEAPPARGGPAPGDRPGVLLPLFFVSGFAALVYQVLWVRELGLLFGSTAKAAALVIAIFFAGIAAGGWFWGRRAPRFASSLRWFGLLEVGVAVTALGHFALVDAYHALYPALHAAVGHSVALDTGAKALVAATILFPPAFLMGGTLPLMGQHLVRARDRLATTGTGLYAVNTAGSACGALAAGFALPLALGFTGAYLLAVGLDLAVGVAAVLLARSAAAAARGRPPAPAAPAPEAAVAPPTPLPVAPRGAAPAPLLPLRLVWAVAFASGFATLAVEVVWTRLFTQVLQNSAYTYALVLATFLAALALGAGIANGLARLRRPSPVVVLGGLLAASAVLTAASPWAFHRVTGGLAYVGSELGWAAYIGAVAGVAGLVMLAPAAVFGAVLPYLLRVLEGADRAPGETIGRLVAANTVGAILGALVAGFVLLPLVGPWRAVLAMAAVYPLLLAAVVLARHRTEPVPAPRPGPRLAGAGVAVGSALALALVAPAGLDDVRLRGEGEWLVEARTGSHANVAVVGVDAQDNRVIRVNNFYTLGGSRNAHTEQDQSVVPLLLHPEPRSVFYLGMGTGITAGAGLAFDVDRVVVCELLPEVVDLAAAHFGPWTNGLFEDPRVEIHAEDGRNCLTRSRETYDVIVADLFTPWKAGTGNLYTREHFATVRDRLEPGGLFAQWLPLYQLSERELAIIAATMDDVFDEVTVWRGDLFSTRSIVALVGHADAAPLDPAVLARAGRGVRDEPHVSDAFYEAIALRMYAGNITASDLAADAPVNTDAHPLIEYLAPRTHRAARTGEASFLVGAERERLYAALRAGAPVDADPYLARLDATQRDYVRAGDHYSRSVWLAAAGRDHEARRERQAFTRLSAPGTVAHTSPARRLLDARRTVGAAAPAGP